MSFDDELLVSPQADGLHWTLHEDLRYTTRIGYVIDVPAGFVTDFASVPRVLWNILPPFGPYTRAAVVHDFLYDLHRRGVGTYTRAFADAILEEAMEDCGVSWVTRNLIWFGVRLGGWVAWNQSP